MKIRSGCFSAPCNEAETVPEENVDSERKHKIKLHLDRYLFLLVTNKNRLVVHGRKCGNIQGITIKPSACWQKYSNGKANTLQRTVI